MSYFDDDFDDEPTCRTVRADNMLLKLPELKDGEKWSCAGCGEYCRAVSREVDYQVSFNPKTGEISRNGTAGYVSNCCTDNLSLWVDEDTQVAIPLDCYSNPEDEYIFKGDQP